MSTFVCGSAPLSVLLCLVLVCFPFSTSATNSSDCSCGFYDAKTGNTFTDSTIVYFNETDQLSDEAFVVESFENKYNRGWNTIYRKGASVSNVEITNDTTAQNLQSLALYCDPSTPDHLVTGASVRTMRQDHFYGSFRTSMRSPRKWFPGSVLSMSLNPNQKESWEVDLMNTDHNASAWVSMLAGDVFPNLWLGVNYTKLEAEGMQPWYYLEYRVDWTPDSIDYFIGGRLQKSMTRQINGTLPATPSALRWQHWSTGDVYASQGPPIERGVANLGSVRLFFNSSTTTQDQQREFDARCKPSLSCSMNDLSLRGSSPYSEESSKEWVQKQPYEKTKWIPICIDIGFGFLTTILLAKTINRRTSWSKLLKKLSFRKKDEDDERPVLESGSGTATPQFMEADSDPATPRYSGTYTPMHHSGTSTPTLASGMSTPINQVQTRNFEALRQSRPSIANRFLAPGMFAAHQRQQQHHISNSPTINVNELSEGPGRRPRVRFNEDTIESFYDVTLDDGHGGFARLHASDAENPFLSEEERVAFASAVDPSRPIETTDPVEPVAPLKANFSLFPPATRLPPPPAEEKSRPKVTAAAVPSTEGGKDATSIPTKRVDYLAGFIAISALLVTVNHFGLTYWAAVIIPSVEPHYPSEISARKSIGSYFLDPLWIGPFLMISTRFLVSGYLRNGKLDSMAMKITMRPFRLLIPVAFVAVLEYFFMDLGAVTWLEYLPSVTWSSWPFTAIPNNAGTFISQVLQLAYLIPNAAPQITYYYCTGVLWTIPVQLQGAWQTILAVIMIREIGTPWKRFGFYAFCILNHWYALSWGSYYYSGVLLADLDLTYKYTKYLYARPWIYYPFFISVCLVAQSGFTIDMVTQHTGVNYATYEYGVHPDVSTGLTITQAGRSTYPDYFIPRLNGLLSTVFMQLVVETSPSVQKVLSLKLFQWIFPHIFTIYLIHGFIFWSLGSWLCVRLFAAGLPYWACILLVAVACYGTLFASMPILTPVIEIVGKNVTQSIWENASQEPAPRRKTLYPFSRELFEEPAAAGGNLMAEPEVEEKVQRVVKSAVGKTVGVTEVSQRVR